MSDFFLDLVLKTDEARRDFETHPVVLDAVAHGMTLQRYRNLLLELYHVVWHFNPVCARRRQPHAGSIIASIRYFLYGTCTRSLVTRNGCSTILKPSGIRRERGYRPQRHGRFTATLCGYNYWCADRQDPCSVSRNDVCAGSDRFGLRRSVFLRRSVNRFCFRTTAACRSSVRMRSMDTEHLVQLRQVLNTLEDSKSRDAVVESTIVNFHHFTRMFEAL